MARQFVRASSQRLDESGASVTAAPITMACWFYADTLVDGTLISLANGSQGLNQDYFTLQAWSDGIIYASNSGGVYASSTASYSSGSWNHAAAVFTSSTSRAAFLNGANKGTNTTSNTPSGVSWTGVGVRPSASYADYFNGRIAEVAIWDTALSDDEIASLNKGYSPLLIKRGNLVHYWPLVGRNSPEVDLRGNRNLTVTGATVGDHSKVILPRKRTWHKLGGGSGGNVTVNATAVSATWSVVAPAVTGTASVSPGAVTVTWAAVTPTVSGAGSVTASPVTATWAAVTPTVMGTAAVTASPVTATWAVVAPTVSTGGNVTVTVSPVTATWVVVAPAVSGYASFSPPALVATWAIVAPTVTTGGSASVTVTASPVRVTWAIVDPHVCIMYRLDPSDDMAYFEDIDVSGDMKWFD